MFCVCTTSWSRITQWRWFWYFPSFDVTYLRTQNNPFASKHGNATYLLSHTRKIMENRPNNHFGVVRKSAEDCAICLDKIQRKKTLNCSHSFCSECIDSLFKFKPACPICNTYHGEYTGNQPEGTMTVMRSWQRLPGYERCGSIVIQYSFPAGIQGVRLTVLKELKRPHEKATYEQSLLTTPFNCLWYHMCSPEGAVFVCLALSRKSTCIGYDKMANNSVTQLPPGGVQVQSVVVKDHPL